jgi:hypothetical protein
MSASLCADEICLKESRISAIGSEASCLIFVPLSILKQEASLYHYQFLRDHWEDQDVEIEWDDMDWIDLAQDRDQRRALVNTVMNLRVPRNAGNFLSSCTNGSFSRRAQLHE